MGPPCLRGHSVRWMAHRAEPSAHDFLVDACVWGDASRAEPESVEARLPRVRRQDAGVLPLVSPRAAVRRHRWPRAPYHFTSGPVIDARPAAHSRSCPASSSCIATSRTALRTERRRTGVARLRDHRDPRCAGAWAMRQRPCLDLPLEDGRLRDLRFTVEATAEAAETHRNAIAAIARP